MVLREHFAWLYYFDVPIRKENGLCHPSSRHFGSRPYYLGPFILVNPPLLTVLNRSANHTFVFYAPQKHSPNQFNMPFFSGTTPFVTAYWPVLVSVFFISLTAVLFLPSMLRKNTSARKGKSERSHQESGKTVLKRGLDVAATSHHYVNSNI